jgi:CyaY protein
MTENEFNALADTTFQRIERILDGSDIDYDNNGGVMEIEFDDGSQIIVNRHMPNREIWLAARSGGFHFKWSNGTWVSQREGDELYAKLAALIKTGSGQTVEF